jgi:ribosomal protein S18 acetylase RimI-like enzyme
VSEPHTHSPGPAADASVRTGRVTDAPAVGLIQATVWRQAYAGQLPDAVLQEFEAPRFAAVWRRSLEHPPSPLHRLLVACAGDQVVGFAAIGPADHAEQDADAPEGGGEQDAGAPEGGGEQDAGAPEGGGELLVLAVHPDARRAGHGSRLLNAAADTLRANDLTALLTWLPATDETARAFVDAAGLAADGSWRDRVVGPDGQILREVRVQGGL